MQLHNKEISKNEIQKLKEKLFRRPGVVWDHLEAGEKEKIDSFAEGYKNFLNHSKTEREAAFEISNFAGASGFKVIYDDPTGHKVYSLYRNKPFRIL